MYQEGAPKGILLNWSLKYEVEKWGKTVGIGKVGKREELLSWKTESWEIKMGKKKAREIVENNPSKEMSRKGLKSQVRVWELL